MSAASTLIKFARKPRREKITSARNRLIDWGWFVPHTGNDRTAYIVGLFGTGRWYINELVLKNMGERAKNFRDEFRFHPGPTSMIYSGHATIKHACRGQGLPEVTTRILEAVNSGFADLIFACRHPLDSLLTNWVWWRTLNRHGSYAFISDKYRNEDELYAELDRNFSEFMSFAAGEPSFFAGLGGPRFLSLSEFVEEIELYSQAATLSLRLEDFMGDPLKEFHKIAKVMSVDVASSPSQIERPRTKAYRYLSVAEHVPRFRSFLDGIDAETRRRINKIGYSV